MIDTCVQCNAKQTIDFKQKKLIIDIKKKKKKIELRN